VNFAGAKFTGEDVAKHVFLNVQIRVLPARIALGGHELRDDFMHGALAAFWPSMGEVEIDHVNEANAEGTQTPQTFRRVVSLAIRKVSAGFAFVCEADTELLRLRFCFCFGEEKEPLTLPKSLAGINAPAHCASGVGALANGRPNLTLCR